MTIKEEERAIAETKEVTLVDSHRGVGIELDATAVPVSHPVERQTMQRHDVGSDGQGATTITVTVPKASSSLKTGISLGRDRCGYVVVSWLPSDGSWAKTDLQQGMRVEKINGKDIHKGMSIIKATEIIRCAQGSVTIVASSTATRLEQSWRPMENTTPRSANYPRKRDRGCYDNDCLCCLYCPLYCDAHAQSSLLQFCCFCCVCEDGAPVGCWCCNEGVCCGDGCNGCDGICCESGCSLLVGGCGGCDGCCQSGCECCCGLFGAAA